jgi:hypothetical protein
MSSAACSVGGMIGRIERLDVLDHRCRVRCADDAQRSSKSSPPDCFFSALRYGMQPCTPPRQNTCWVNGHGVIAVPGRHSHHSEQFDSQLSLTATDTRPHRSAGALMRRGRSLALDHGSVYLHPTGAQYHPRCSAIPGHMGGPAASGRAPSRGWHHVQGVPSTHQANRRGCRSAIR